MTSRLFCGARSAHTAYRVPRTGTAVYTMYHVLCAYAHMRTYVRSLALERSNASIVGGAREVLRMCRSSHWFTFVAQIERASPKLKIDHQQLTTSALFGESLSW